MEPAQHKYNLTEGGILKKLLLVAVPIMGTHLMQMAYNLADLFWLGRLGSDAVAAAGAGGMYLWLSFGFLLIGRMGAEIGVAQHLGKGDKKAAEAFSQNAILVALVLGLLFGCAMVFFNRQMIGFFNFREEHVVEMARDYIFFTGLPIPLVFVTSVIAGTFNASGNSRTPFITNSIGLALNITLDPIFIFTLGLGVKGAAMATVVAQTISCSMLIIALYTSKQRPFPKFTIRFRPELNKIITMLKWSVPIGLESILFCFLSMLCARIEASFGADAVAVARIGTQIESLSWLIGGGFGSALVAFIGQNYGAGKWDRINRGVKISAGVMAIWGSLVTLLFFTLGPAIFRIFLPDPNLYTMARGFLFILAFCQLSMNLEAVASGAFRGTGRTIPPSLVSIVTNGIRPVLALILSQTSLGIYGVWIAVSITAVMRGAGICIWYYISAKKTQKSHH
jgi:putative MATE family efflux protein